MILNFAQTGMNYRRRLYPELLRNKAFWFRADDPADGEVTSWRDRYSIGNAVSVTSRNTPNKVDDSGASMRFTRLNNEILRAPAITGITNYTLFIVFKANDTTSSQKLLGNGGATNTANGFDVNINAGNVQINNRNTVSQGLKSFAFTDTASYHVLTVKWQSIGSGTSTFFSRTVFKLDNVVKVTDSDSRVLQSSTAQFDIGSDGAATPNSFDGYIREIICVKDWLTESEERNIYTYLNNQWGMSISTVMPVYTYSKGLVQSTDAKTATLGTASLFTDNFEYGNYLDTYENVLPVLIIMHGYTDIAEQLNAEAYTRLANLGFFVIGVQMRGRSGSTGTRDSSGQEVYDIYDVYQNFLTKYSGLGIIDPNRVIISGYSGGGGNALAFAARFPDLCPVVVSHFGISDYGYNGTDSWYIQESTRQTQLDTDVGSPRTSFLNEYRVRNTVEAIAKNLKGKLFLFHDDQDTAVHVTHSANIKTQYTSEGRSIQEDKYSAFNSSDLRYSVTTTSDTPRWTHANPTDAADITDAEPIWTDVAKSADIPTMPDTGTLRILGWVRTKKFYILLGNGTAASDGKVRCADLTYDYVNNSYTVTPLLESGATDLTISIVVIGGAHDGKTASGTISTATEFIPI
jgi:pimeloyl-ACP methyl ester carboxylesterase